MFLGIMLIFLTGCKGSKDIQGKWYAENSDGKQMIINVMDESITFSSEGTDDWTVSYKQTGTGFKNNISYKKIEFDDKIYSFVFPDKKDIDNAIILIQFLSWIKYVSDSFLLCSSHSLVLRNTRTYLFSPVHFSWLPHIKYRYSTQRLLIPYTHGQTESYGFCYWLTSLRNNRHHPCLSRFFVLGHRHSKFGLYSYHNLLLLVLLPMAPHFPFRFLSFEIHVYFQ